MTQAFEKIHMKVNKLKKSGFAMTVLGYSTLNPQMFQFGNSGARPPPMGTVLGANGIFGGASGAGSGGLASSGIGDRSDVKAHGMTNQDFTGSSADPATVTPQGAFGSLLSTAYSNLPANSPARIASLGLYNNGVWVFPNGAGEICLCVRVHHANHSVFEVLANHRYGNADELPIAIAEEPDITWERNNNNIFSGPSDSQRINNNSSFYPVMSREREGDLGITKVRKRFVLLTNMNRLHSITLLYHFRSAPRHKPPLSPYECCQCLADLAPGGPGQRAWTWSIDDVEVSKPGGGAVSALQRHRSSSEGYSGVVRGKTPSDNAIDLGHPKKESEAKFKNRDTTDEAVGGSGSMGLRLGDVINHGDEFMLESDVVLNGRWLDGLGMFVGALMQDLWTSRILFDVVKVPIITGLASIRNGSSQNPTTPRNRSGSRSVQRYYASDL